MRRLGRLQDRCQNMIAPGGRFLREKFSRKNENPHGFELVHTLSCKPKRAGSARFSYRLTVTLNVPTLPLLSKERSEIVCSPGDKVPKSTE